MNRFYSVWLLTLAMLLAVAGCTSSVRVQVNGTKLNGSSTELEVVERFDYERLPINANLAPLTELSGNGYSVSEITFPSIGENGQSGDLVTAHYYKNAESSAKPLIIILPIWGSYKYPSTKIGKGIRRRGKSQVHVIMMQGEAPIFDWEAMHEDVPPEKFEYTLWRMGERIRVTSMDVRRILDWAETRSEIDQNRISLVGFSMGAIVSSLAIMHDRRFHSTVLVMGGADLGKIVATCHGRLELLRETAMTRYGWTIDQMREVASRAFGHINQIDFPGRVDPRSILFIDATKDKCMPQSSRDALWNALGQPERISYNYGHHGAFLAMTPLGFNVMRRQIYRFLEKSLGYGKAAKR
ncbi:MAG: hypothetical protein V3T39_03795 [Gammaproteobacteria bacterium]